ncbi:MAG: pilin, partial [Candidatus Uhrbacteria bacterium]|nr:pilin [Candidatus Uhrbacteria bacterium]
MRLRRFLFTSGLVLITGTLFIFPFGTFAAEDTCECYCNVEGTGATKVPNESTKVTVDRCQELCREGGYSVATCAQTPSQKPQYNTMCFTPDECTAQKGVQTASGLGTPPQPGECKAGMYYCYPDPAKRQKATLQVKIGGLISTGDLGEYVSYAYKWMLGAGTTIAIVFLMVSGLRWTLGGANAEQIGKAKKTIQNAVIGLVLLLSTYVIVFTVNPYLIRLQVPAFPMIKPISLVGE